MSNTIILLLFICLAIVGCVSTKRIVLESEYIRSVMRTGEPIEAIKSVGLTDNELMTITNSANAYAAFNEKWGVVSDLEISKKGNELYSDYKKLRVAYYDTFIIAKNNWDRYTIINKAKLDAWHERAQEIDAKVETYVNQENYKELAIELISYTAIGSKIAAFLPTR